MPLISIVIPLYNKDFIIKETLKSVLSQTYTDYEVIIVNDGSTDDSLKIASSFNDSRIKIFNQENKGVSCARNLGIKNATGELISFLDADDYWHPNHLKEITKLYKDYPNCGMYCSRYSIQFTKKKKIKTHYNDEVSNTFRGVLIDYFKASMKYRVGLTSAVSVRKRILIQDNLEFNENINNGEDTELFTKIAIKNTVAVTNKYTVIYNFSQPYQLSKIDFERKKLRNLDVFSSYENENKSLKIFLDLYRIEYALQYKIIGNKKKFEELLAKTNYENISFKTKILFKLPPILLKLLLLIKKLIRKLGIDFSIYL